MEMWNFNEILPPKLSFLGPLISKEIKKGPNANP